MSLSGFGSSVCIEHTFTIFDGECYFVDIFVISVDVVYVGDGENLERSCLCKIEKSSVERLESAYIVVGLDEIGEEDVVLSNELLEIADLFVNFILRLTESKLFSDPGIWSAE